MELRHLNKEDFDQAVNAGDDLVVVDFFADWCTPCQMLGPVVAKAAEQYPDVHFYKVDTQTQRDLALRFRVLSIPTLLYMKRGTVLHRSTGYVDAGELVAAVEQYKNA